jgi:PAS domain S-box-containing protein
LPQNSRILIVEDEMIISMEIKQKLKVMGYDIAGQVISGEAAIQKAGETNPDLILMDIRLKGEMDGITAAKRIMDLYDIPIIFLTAHSDKATLERAIAVSPSGYLLKPFKERELMTNIEMSLHKHRIKQKVRGELHPEGSKEISKILKLIPHPVLVISQSGNIEGINISASELSGFSQNELVGKPVNILFCQRTDGLEQNNNEKKAENNFILPDQVSLKHKDGKKSPVTLYIGFIMPAEPSSDLRYIIIFESEENKPSDSIQIGPEMIRHLVAITSALQLPAFVIDKNMVLTGYNVRFAELARKIGISQYMLNRPLYETPRFSFFGDIQSIQEIFKSGDKEKQIKKVTIDEKNRFIEFTRIPMKKNDVTSHIATVINDVTSEQNAIYNAERIMSILSDFFLTLEEIESLSHEIRVPLQEELKKIHQDVSTLDDDMKTIISQIYELMCRYDTAWIKYSDLKDQIYESSNKGNWY